jgi:arylsulfatase A-like enzyme
MEPANTRRIFLLTIALASLVGLSSCGENGDRDERPNLLLVVVDTLRADHLESYGYGRQTMPLLSGLAREGALFRNAFCQATWTGASMSSLFTSTYPSTHGFQQNTLTDNVLGASFVTLAESLAEAGYETIGHSTNVYISKVLGLAQGFSSFVEHEHLADADEVTAAAIASLDGWHETSKAPLFLYVHYMEPHCPYSPPPAHLALFRSNEIRPLPADFRVPPHIDIGSRDISDYESAYDGEIHFAGSEIEKLLARLQELELARDTLVVITADHGEELFERGEFGHGRTFHEEVLRVPLVLRLPSRIPAGIALEAPVELVDVVPTILDLLGVPAPALAEGESLRPLLEGTAKERRKGDAVYSELHIKGPPRVMLRTRGYKAVCTTSGEPEMTEYFDLPGDPGETRNRAAELDDETREGLIDRLVLWRRSMIEKGETLRSQEQAPLSEENLRRLRDLGYVDEEK